MSTRTWTSLRHWTKPPVVGLLGLALLAGCSSGATTAATPTTPTAAVAPTASSTAASAVGESAAGSTTTGSTTAAESTTAAGSTSAAESTSAAPAAPRVLPEGFGSQAADGVFPRTVVHFGGTTVIPARPQRVVVMGTGQLDGMLLLGVVPVGSAKAAKAELVPPYLSAAYPELQAGLASMADVGLRLEPNLEAVAAVAPDLILSNSAAAEGIVDQLSQIAPTVLAEGTGVNWKQDFLLVADAVGATEQAQAELDGYHRRATDFGARFAGDGPTVSMVRFTSDQARVFGVSSFAGSIAEDARLTRPAQQQFAGTSQDVAGEQLQVVDADWIFAGAQPGTDLAAETAAPLWGTLGAVAAGHVVTVDDDPWYLNAGPTAANLVLQQMISTLGD